jgi:hypothetical protein
MIKRSTTLCLMAGALLLPAVTMNVLAAEPTGGPGTTTPKYLAIPDVKKCLGEKSKGTWTEVCVPAEKPAACPKESWKQLNDLTGTDKVPSC